MGLAKHWYEETRERGYGALKGFVCGECADEPFLAGAVSQALTGDECSYCGQRAQDGAPIAADVNLVLRLVTEGLLREYVDPIDEAGWNGAEGGYQVSLESTDDLLAEYEVTRQERLVADLTDQILTTEWCRRNPYHLDPAEKLSYGWKDFRDHVMHKRRYTFLVDGQEDERKYTDEGIPPSAMLSVVAQTIEIGRLVVELPTGTLLYRGRPHEPQDRPRLAKDLGTPPDHMAKTNRMSPAGVGAFYGASSVPGALAEIRAYSGEGPVTVGRFVTLKPLKCVDLVQAPPVPSLFDADGWLERPAKSFLRGFIEEIARPATPNDENHLDYVPTQVVAEFLRYVLDPADPVMAVRWQSSLDPQVTDTVVFVSNKQCIDETPDHSWVSDGYLGLEAVEGTFA